MKPVAKFIIFLLLLFISQTGQSSEILPRIVGGQPADDGEWPATVGLLRKATVDRVEAGTFLDSNGNPIPANQANFQAQFCGASLLTPKWVLTAAHCVGNINNPADIIALIGATDLLVEGTRMVVTNIIVHPDWNSVTNDSDIALLELAQNAKYPAETIPMFDGDPAVGISSTVVGWGARNFDLNDPLDPNDNVSDDFPVVLEEVEVPVVAQSTCNAAYDSTITSNMICAGFASGSKDSCQGDSGGPLMAQQEGIFRQIGIVSFGSGCALPDAYGVYTRVDKFSNWLATYTDVGDSPVITHIAAAANVANQSAYPVSGSCTAGDGDVTVEIVGATPVSQSVACSGGGVWNAIFDVGSISDGTNVIDISASQAAVGSTDNAPLIEADKDIVVPTVATTSAPTATTANQMAYPVSGACSAGEGNVAVSIVGASPGDRSIGCGAGGNWNTVFNVSAIASGSKVIDVKARQTDAAGNTGFAALVEADKDAPAADNGGGGEGGGGGAISWLFLPLTLLGLFRRRLVKYHGQLIIKGKGWGVLCELPRFRPALFRSIQYLPR